MVLVRRLIWDPGNVSHIAGHDVTLEEVEEVCHGEHVERQAYAGRLMVIGPTQAGRLLAVVLDPEADDVYYPVSARPASRKERRVYRGEKGGETR